jgi:hypothetical protein
MTKLFKLTTQNVTDIKTAIDTNGKLETAIGNHRANFYVTLTGMFQDSGVDMDVFKAAIATGLNAYFGRADRQSEAQVKAKAKPMPQVVIDWAGRVQQTVTLGIKPATIKTMSEGEMKKEIALVKAAAKQGVTRAAIVKAAGGAKAPLKAVEKAIKAATIKADPSSEKERIALAELVNAIRAHMASLDHAGRMNYMASLVTTAKANPAEAAAANF